MALCNGCVGWGEDPPVFFMTYPDAIRFNDRFLNDT